MRYMSRFRLQKEEQIAVLLRFLVVREEALLQVCGILEMIRDLILLHSMSGTSRGVRTKVSTSSRAMRF